MDVDMTDNARRRKNGTECILCLKCVEACPFGVMLQVAGAPAASKCIACGICVKACPMEVLEIRES